MLLPRYSRLASGSQVDYKRNKQAAWAKRFAIHDLAISMIVWTDATVSWLSTIIRSVNEPRTHVDVLALCHPRKGSCHPSDHYAPKEARNPVTVYRYLSTITALSIRLASCIRGFSLFRYGPSSANSYVLHTKTSAIVRGCAKKHSLVRICTV